MNQHRYKATFSAQNSTDEFFDSFTWINYGFWLTLIVSIFAHGFIYYHSETGFAYEGDLKCLVINAFGLAALFVLRLFAINFYKVGFIMAILCLLASITFITLMFYVTFTDHFPIAYIGGVLYFGVAGFLLNKDYKQLK
jgi:fatty acid desaturase